MCACANVFVYCIDQSSNPVQLGPTLVFNIVTTQIDFDNNNGWGDSYDVIYTELCR